MYDLAIIGAGPAGMAAAATACAHGLNVALLDEQPRPGGQIYRDVERVDGARSAILGADYRAGGSLAQELRAAKATYLPSSVVWAIEEGFQISYTHEGRGAQLSASRILLATGALERPMPLPGWTLPGVMTVGAAQILLKQSGLLARRAVLVGSGPLIYLVAAQMVRAGTPPLALVETQPRGAAIHAALRHAGSALRGWRYLAKGLGLIAEIRRAGVQRHVGASGLAVIGKDRAEGLRFACTGQTHEIACDTVLLHHGVVPNTQAARALGVAHAWDAAQHCFVPCADAWGATDMAGVLVAGDGAGIGGAEAADASGRLAALRVGHDLGLLSDRALETAARPLRALRARALAARPLLDEAYPPCPEALSPADETIVCRCEEVTAGAVRGYARLGCVGPNQAKAFGRVGMGPCQGRYCGLTVTGLLAAANGQSHDETGYFRIRAPLKPITLGELAEVQDTPFDGLK